MVILSMLCAKLALWDFLWAYNWKFGGLKNIPRDMWFPARNFSKKNEEIFEINKYSKYFRVESRARAGPDPFGFPFYGYSAQLQTYTKIQPKFARRSLHFGGPYKDTVHRRSAAKTLQCYSLKNKKGTADERYFCGKLGSSWPDGFNHWHSYFTMKF